MSSPNATGTDPWDIVAYNVRMLFGLCGLLVRAQDMAVSDVANNALVESACLHTRVLIDILLSKDSRKGDDVRLDARLPRFNHRSLSELRAAYGDAKTRGTSWWTVNKMIMHPTIMRGSSHDYTNLLNRLLPLIQAIWQAVDASNRAGGTASLPSSTHGVYPGLQRPVPHLLTRCPPGDRMPSMLAKKLKIGSDNTGLKGAIRDHHGT